MFLMWALSNLFLCFRQKLSEFALSHTLSLFMTWMSYLNTTKGLVLI